MDYDPGHRLRLRSRTLGYELAFTIGPNDWYDPEVLGNDGKDWLKAGGVSYLRTLSPGTWPKNRLSALVGFRMSAGRTYEVAAFVNDRDGGRRINGITRLAIGDTANVSYRLREDACVYTIRANDQRRTYRFEEVKAAAQQVAVGPWHGGTSPAPVTTGVWTKFSYIDGESSLINRK